MNADADRTNLRITKLGIPLRISRVQSMGFVWNLKLSRLLATIHGMIYYSTCVSLTARIAQLPTAF